MSLFKLYRETKSQQLLAEQLLLEDRLDYLKTSLKDKISFDHDPAAKIKDSDALIDHIATKVDPTVAKVHTQWVANQYKKGALAQEDFPKVKKALKGFELTKKNLEVKDLNKFNSLADLEDHVAVQKGRTQADIKDKEKDSSPSDEKLEQIYSSDHGTGFKVPSAKVSKDLYGPSGKLAKTNWCTASSSANNMFSHYKGGKYTFHTPEGAVLQIHHQSGQIMDERNVPISLNSNPRFSPHKEAIKEFITQTHEKEGFTNSSPSSLVRKTGATLSKEHIQDTENNINSTISNGRNYLGRNNTEALENHPLSSHAFENVLNWAKTQGGAKGSHYDDHIEAQVAMAKNPSTPSHVLDELHKMHTGSQNESNMHSALAANPSVQGETRSALKEHPTFASRGDLTSDEISHIVKNGSEESRKSLYNNHTVPLSEHDQKTAYEKEEKPKEFDTYGYKPISSLLKRPDMHSSIADTALNDNVNVHHEHLVSKASTDYINKNFKELAPKHIYDRESHEGLSPEVIKHVVSSGGIPTSDIKPEHADIAAESGKYDGSRMFHIKGASKQHYDDAAKKVLGEGSIYELHNAYNHPKVSPELKTQAISSIAKKYDSDYNDVVGETLKNLPINHITTAMSQGNNTINKVLAGSKNIQKSHFDEMVKNKALHGAIVNSKSAPPSILSQLADSSSDYIRSKVKKHKNTPPDVASKIEFDENKV